MLIHSVAKALKARVRQILFMFFVSFSTPVVKDKFLPGCQISAPYNQFPYLPHTPATPFQNHVGLQVIIFCHFCSTYFHWELL